MTASTPARPCLMCRKPLRDTDRIRNMCDRCLRNTRKALRSIGDYYVQAGRELAPSAGSGGGGTPSKGEHSIGLNVAALDFRAGGTILRDLENLERQVRAAHDLTPYGEVSYTRLEWLLRHYPRADQVAHTFSRVIDFLDAWLERHTEQQLHDDVARTFHKDIRTVAGRARAAARAMPRQSWRVSCPADVTKDDDHPNGRCGRMLRVSGADFGDPDVKGTGTEIHCRGCGTSWPVERLLLVVAADTEADVWLPLTEVLHLLPVASERTVRHWARRGRVKRAHGLYELGSVRRAIRESLAPKEIEHVV